MTRQTTCRASGDYYLVRVKTFFSNASFLTRLEKSEKRVKSAYGLTDMKEQWKAGVSFGLTSGAITTMGLMVGLHSGTHAKLAVMGGVVTIAVADAFSDALGVHIHEEAENVHTHKEIWVVTLATFISKFVFSLSFIIPLLLFQLTTAIVVSVVWGLFLVALISAFVAKDQGIKIRPVIAEHVFIALLVVVITHFLGVWVNSIFVG